jgi:hypothetical protein
LLFVETIARPILFVGYFLNLGGWGLSSLVSIVIIIIILIFWPFNLSPKIISTPIIGINVGSTYYYPVVAIDFNIGDTLSFSTPTMPGFLTLNSLSGIVTGAIAAVDTGTHTIRIEVRDQLNAMDWQEYQLTVSP